MQFNEPSDESSSDGIRVETQIYNGIFFLKKIFNFFFQKLNQLEAKEKIKFNDKSLLRKKILLEIHKKLENI